ncbi:MAG TPA: MFS transporter [Marmoricola sp.]|nr:MFS transporter [Marmoricola sp.]
MSPLTSYRHLLDLAGPAYVAVAFLGRLPLSMSQLGTLLLVSTATDSYGTGGLAAGALAVSNAAGSPIAGAVADRVGQRPVVLVQSLAGAVAMVALVLLTLGGQPGPVLVAASVVTGFVLPQVGPLARVRWRPMTESAGQHQRRLMNAAFSYEGAADEASFVIGPALVGVVAVIASPAGAMITAASLLAVFGSGFALHESARLTGGASRAVSKARLVTGVFVTLLAAQLLIGVLFGATQTGTTALAEKAGEPGLAGLIHALLGVGSVIAGLATVILPERIGHERRVLGSAVALVAFSWPLLLVDSLTGLVAVVLLLGFGVAPYMIGVFSLGERAVPQSRVGTAMTLLAGATGIGYAVGSSVAGRLVDVDGYTAAFGVTVAATILGLLLAAIGQRAWQRTASAPEPVAAVA